MPTTPDGWRTPGANRRGEPGQPIPFASRPPRPRDLTVKVLAVGSFRASWKDQIVHGPRRAVSEWMITHAAAGLVGNPNGAVNWAEVVLKKATTLGTVASSGLGEPLSFTHTSSFLLDGYVQVTGVTADGIQGLPSEPVFVRLTTAIDVIPPSPNPLHVGITDRRETIQGIEYLVLNPVYVAPGNSTGFAGMQLYVDGYAPAGTNLGLMEVDTMHRYSGHLGIQQSSDDFWMIRLPMDRGLGSGTGSFGAGPTTTFTRTSGDFFTAAMAGNRIYVPDASDPDGVANFVNAFIDPNTLNLSFSHIGGPITGSWRVVNNMTFYFVPVGHTGQRLANPATGTQVTI